MTVYFRHTNQVELKLVLEFLKEAALWLQKGRSITGKTAPPSVEFVDWISEGFQNNEFYLICREDKAIGCFRLQWSDELF